ncbi:MAG: YceI family protein [Candidatus Acidiferrales bacterium]
MDAAQSQFTVHAFASGLAAVVAHNPKFAIRDFSGEAQYILDTLRDASIRVKIKASSLELMDEVSEYDRGEIDRVMFEEVLEVSRFPEIIYTSTQISATRLSENLYATTIAGKLALHGVTKELDFSAQVVIGEDAMRGYGSFSVKQSQYDIAIASIAAEH